VERVFGKLRFAMAASVQFRARRDADGIEFPQREAAFFYGLFLRGHSADKLRQDIEVPPTVLANGIAKPNASRSCAIFYPVWWRTAAMCLPFLIPWWTQSGLPSGRSR